MGKNESYVHELELGVGQGFNLINMDGEVGIQPKVAIVVRGESFYPIRGSQGVV